MSDDKNNNPTILGQLTNELRDIDINRHKAKKYREDLEAIDKCLGLDDGRYFPENSERLAAIHKLKKKNLVDGFTVSESRSNDENTTTAPENDSGH